MIGSQKAFGDLDICGFLLWLLFLVRRCISGASSASRCSLCRLRDTAASILPVALGVPFEDI